MNRIVALDLKPEGWLRFVCILLIGAFNWCPISAQTPNELVRPFDPKELPAPLKLNLRIVWGGDEDADYQGFIQTTASKITCKQQLGIDPYDAGFLPNAADSLLKFHDPMTRFGGCDIVVEGQPLDQITCQIQCTDSTLSKHVEKSFGWTLENLRDASHVMEIGPQNNKISISRVPGDCIRFETARTHLVYNSEEPLAFQLQPYALPWQGIQCLVEYTIVRLEDDAEMIRQTRPIFLDELGNAEVNNVLLLAPREHGVYELRCRIEPKRFIPNLIGKKALIERSIQFVVFDNVRPLPENIKQERTMETDGTHHQSQWHTLWHTSSGEMNMQTLTEVVFNEGRTAKRFPILDAAMSLTKRTRDLQRVSPSPESIKDEDAPENDLVINPNCIGSARLQGLQVGQMHRVKLVIDRQHPRLCFVIQEDKLAPTLTQAGGFAYALDEQVDSSVESILQLAIDPKDSHQLDVIELLFWPTSENATLSITNKSNRQDANLVECSIDRWGDRDSKRISHVQPKSRERALNTLELHGSDLRSMFSSGRFAKPPYDDWVQFLHFADSLGKYCIENRIDSVAMVVDAAGGSLYPSQQCNANRRNDTGTFSNSGRDPLQKDQLELLYRVLGQYNIGFIPMLELGGPIRELEEAITDLDLQDVVQGTSLKDKAAVAEKRSYNPTSARVQRAMTSCVDELHQRYHSHPNFRGLAIRLNTASHLSASVPYEHANPAMKEKFSADMLMNKSKAIIKGGSQNPIQTNSDYQNWVIENAVRYVKRLGNKIIFISCTDPLMASLSQETLSDPEMLVHSPILLHCELDLSVSPKRKILESWNTQFPVANSFAMGESSHRLFRHVVDLNDFGRGFDAYQARSVPHLDGSGSISKVRVWQSTEENGDLLLSNAGSVDEVVQLEWDSLPQNYEVVIGTDTQGRWIPDTRNCVMNSSKTGEWMVRIMAGDALRIQLHPQPDPGLPWMALTNPKAISWKSFDPVIKQSLSHALDLLERSLNVLNVPVRLEGKIRNSGFESVNSSLIRGRLDGWTTSLDSHATISIDPVVVAAGANSLKIDSRKDSTSAWIQSDSFVLIEAERLLVGLRIAATKFPSQATLSLSRLESESERFELVASRDLTDLTREGASGTKWNALQFDMSQELSTLPNRSDPQVFRLQIETKGITQIWIDDLFLSTEFLTSEERRDMRSELFLAKASMQHDDTQPANHILASPQMHFLQYLLSDPSVKLVTRLPISTSRPIDPKSESSVATPSSPSKVPTKPSLGRRIRNLWGQHE